MTAPTRRRFRVDASGRVLQGAWLTVMWLLLWGDLSLANVLSGAAVAAAVVVGFRVGPPADDRLVLRPLATLRLAGWFAVALVRSNLAVARQVVTPTPRGGIRTAIVACPLSTRSRRLTTVIANAITLTPGTMTVEVRGDPATLFVHVMSFDSVPATRRSVSDLEARVVRAFGPTAEEQA